VIDQDSFKIETYIVGVRKRRKSVRHIEVVVLSSCKERRGRGRGRRQKMGEYKRIWQPPRSLQLGLPPPSLNTAANKVELCKIRNTAGPLSVSKSVVISD